MVVLTPYDRQQLTSFLQDLPELQTERQRRQILELAGLKELIPRINVSDPTFAAVNEIVSYLSTFGRMSHEQEALGMLLNVIKSFVGVQQQEFLTSLLLKYEMITPIAPIPMIDLWHGSEAGQDVLGKNHW
ncbi:MAG: hypothetical protein M3437_10020 [Chloroflexota bacterium]|nr:hypothetical protein [Chloroflexota bacterium]MDQ5865426.1 hypothetical protein [Chloroflexota bacterium]